MGNKIQILDILKKRNYPITIGQLRKPITFAKVQLKGFEITHPQSHS